jgi:hypothetical protein
MLRSETTVLATVYTSGHWTYFTKVSPDGNIEPLSTTV